MEHRPVNSVMIKKRRANKPMIVLSIINFIFTILFILFVINLHMIPTKFILVLTLFLCVFDFVVLLLLKNKMKIFKILGYLISFILIFISLVGMYYVSKTNSFLNKAFNNASNSYTNTYYIVTLSDEDTYKSISDLQNQKIGYYENIPNVQDALNELNGTLEYEQEKIDDLYSVFYLLNKKKVSAILMEQSLYNFVMDIGDTFVQEDYTILYSFDLTFEEEIEEIESNGDTFNIYIGGTDFTELYTDFNMIVTVNTKTHKILLTSTPRDYYVTLYGKGGSKDLLGYAGVWGINTSRKTLESLYDINIDYYMKINTKSLVGLVDTLDGVTFCSDISYYTTHATVMGTYDDTKGKKLYVSKGCKEYSGIEILTIARERKAYTDGDRQRQKNCQQIMINIFNKMMRPENLANYSGILNAVSDLYTTNIPRSLVTQLANETLDGAKWTFEQQSVTGSDSSGYVHLSNVKDYVMIPNKDSVATATANIKKVQSGK